MSLHAIQPTNIASYNEVLKVENLTFDLSSNAYNHKML